jgi:hypothetical protein
MRTIEPNPSYALGFLTVLDCADCGLIGGYLVLNRTGRPLEFHCTVPIKPNRAQQILYGPTLEPYLFGEQIGQALLAKGAVEPEVICTDRPAALAVREFVEIPVALVLSGGIIEAPVDGAYLANACPTPAEGVVHRLDAPHGLGPHHLAFRLGRNHLAVSPLAAGDRELIANRLGELADTFDLAEPFERIRAAIEEARRGGGGQ